ncbi:MAG: carboxypeptidase regulatory-like domain-containing protein [Caldilineaceae bacterium]|nr:carboxypeptidase regulatory-like domain-containing protein [Caldilineaceae bacterium]
MRQSTWLYQQLRTGWQELWRREDGANLIFVAFAMTVLLGFAGLAIDGSNIYYQNQRIQISADAAALGGARKLAAAAEHGAVDTEIHELAFANHADSVTWDYINGNRGVHVVASRTFPAYFARIYGHSNFTVHAEAEAQYEFVTGAGGLFPFTIDCCFGEGTSSLGGNGGGGGGGAAPTPTPSNDTSPTSGTVEVADSQESTYGFTYVGQTGNTWTYEVSEVDGSDLSYWLLNISSCLDNIVSSTPSGATMGVDGGTGVAGIKWNVNSAFTSGTFSFTLDDNYPSGQVDALAKADTAFGTVKIRGPICDGTNIGDGSGGGSGVTSLCIPTLDFETDAAGAALVAGQVIDTEWAAWGVRVTTNSAANHPAMIFNTANPTGGDTDLGAPNQAFGGPGIGAGGGASMPGSNSAPLGKVLIVAESANSANPDDSANGGTLVFTFDYSVRIDDVQILDIDNAAAAGTIKAYRDTSGTTLVATGKMLGLGDNSIQTVGVNGLGVRRLEINFPQSGAVASIVSCRNGAQDSYTLGNLLWSDTNSNHLQDSGEPGIAGVALELYVSGQNYVIANATTNAGGEYLFSNLPAGNYEVKIAASNFDTGKPLAGATYATANSGSDDSRDSDFNASTGRAPAVITNGNVNTVDGGFRVPANTASDPGSQSVLIKVNDNQNSSYMVSLESVVGNTWTYRVKEESGRDLKSWSLGIVNCLDKVVSSSPTPSSGSAGILWDVHPSFSNSTFSFTLNGAYEARRVQAIVSSANASAQLPITGPDCSASATTPPSFTPTPSPTPDGSGQAGSGEECDCSDGAGFVYGEEYILHEPVQNAPGNFGWLRWQGDNPNAPDLEYNIRHPEESPVLHIGDWVQGTTGQTNSSGVGAALDYWRGKQVTIPIYDRVTGTGSNAQYRICTFAVFILNDWDRQSKTMTGTFVRTLVHSVETGEGVPDLGARDVRIIQ